MGRAALSGGVDSSGLAAWAALARPYSGCVYLSPAACAGRPRAARALAASALLLAAVERVAAWDGARDAPRRRVVEVIRDEIRDQPQAAGALLLPAEARLQRLALALSDDPADTRTLAQWANWIGMAPRTLARHFPGGDRPVVASARLMRALEMLAAGAAVTGAGLTTSAPSSPCSSASMA